MVKDDYKIIHVLKSGQLVNAASVKVPMNDETEVFYRFVAAFCKNVRLISYQENKPGVN